MNAERLLPDALALAVPLWIDQLRGTSHIHRRARAHHCVEILAHGGEGVFYLTPTKKKPKNVSESYRQVGTAEAFNRLAEAIAIGAFELAGIRAFGIHWCAAHHPGGVLQASQLCADCRDPGEGGDGDRAPTDAD